MSVEDANPLTDPNPGAWERLIESLDPASLLLVIESRLGTRLAVRVTPEDVLQDALLAAWRDRSQCRWEGVRAFRSWFLTIIDHRIRNIAEHHGALKRGGGAPVASLSPPSESAGTSPLEPRDWSTPSRVAARRERKRAMDRAFLALDPQIAEIVRLRVYEELTIDQISAQTGLDEAAVRRRLRKGAVEYEAALQTALADTGPSTEPASPGAASVSPPAS